MKIFILILTIGLTGCAGFSGITQQAASTGAEVNDEVIKSSKFVLCQGASVGAVKREFDTPEEFQIWLDLCGWSPNFRPELNRN